MPRKFVILHHQTAGGEHWDIMLEHGDLLATWQLLREPVDRASLPIPATRIGGHRKGYLDYEGPISGDRGHVRRVDAGTVLISEFRAGECTFVLHGKRLTGMFRLTRGQSGWRLEALEPSVASTPVRGLAASPLPRSDVSVSRKDELRAARPAQLPDVPPAPADLRFGPGATAGERFVEPGL